MSESEFSFKINDKPVKEPLTQSQALAKQSLRAITAKERAAEVAALEKGTPRPQPESSKTPSKTPIAAKVADKVSAVIERQVGQYVDKMIADLEKRLEGL